MKTIKDLSSLEEIADFLIWKAKEIQEVYFLESIKLIKAAEILNPKIQNENNKTDKL